jgi:pyruvate-ferredoxin/flavodoxin oxidoreductase
MLLRLTQDDVVHRRHLDPKHRAFVPDFGVLVRFQLGDKVEERAISRQLVLFCVERRKAWRLLQSKAGLVNRDYQAQRELLADVDAGRVSREELLARGEELARERRQRGAGGGAPGGNGGTRPAAAPPASVPSAAAPPPA